VRPHVGVLGRGEAVEIDRIRREPQIAQLGDVGKKEGQNNISEFQAVRAAHV